MDAKYREFEAVVAGLRAEIAELKALLAASEKRNRQQSATIDRLKAKIDKLTADLDEAQRKAKRQAAPFRKGDGPKAKPKKPGRKSGKRHGRHGHRGVPPRIDERFDVPLPDVCPHCGGRHCKETEVTTQYQTEIPRKPIYRQFDIHVGQCQDCGRRVQGRHELQTSDAVGAAASQLGPDAHAAFVILNKDLGLSHGKCARVFDTLFGIPIARATSVRSNFRTAKLGEAAYKDLQVVIRGSPFVVPDETGWRVGGRSAWLHGFVTETATYYAIGDRSSKIAEALLGLDWPGTLIRDGWSVYDCFLAASHQQCLGHLQRRCERILESAVGAAVILPRTILQLIDEAFAVRRAWRGHRLTADEMAGEGLRLACELEALVSGTFTYEPNRRLAAHVRRHSMQWFWFLIDPTIDATNYRAEQAMRPAVVNRKVWGGNRTWLGADVQAVLLSLNRTLLQRGHDPLLWFSTLRRSTSPLLLPASVR
jgi:transposase